MSSGDTKTDFDVLIIGAGIAGICFAHRLRERCPSLSFCILEQRHELGGTWSLFQYPGLRSDSDLYTFGFPWLAWSRRESVAKGTAILVYLNQAAHKAGIDKHIAYNHRVNEINWRTESRNWTSSITVGDGSYSEEKTLRSQFVFLATGYYDYKKPLEAYIPNVNNFQGDVIHPQFWPPGFDYTNKHVAIIGSGATAITLLPSMADRAKHVTMIQRSPSYIMSIPAEDGLERMIRAVAPCSLASKLIRAKWIIFPTVFRQLCILFPNAARRMLHDATVVQLDNDPVLLSHFKPTYNPFDQRVCMCPNGDFFQSLKDGKASIKTGHIENVSERGIKLSTGEEVQPDVIVTATGLKLQLAGGIRITKDEKPYLINQNFVWRGAMFEDLPNLFFSFGYLDASWTLAVDTSAQLASRVVEEMMASGATSATPKRSRIERESMKELQFMPLSSTYVQKARADLPKVGDRYPWRPRSTYYWEQLELRIRSVRTGLEWL